MAETNEGVLSKTETVSRRKKIRKGRSTSNFKRQTEKTRNQSRPERGEFRKAPLGRSGRPVQWKDLAPPEDSGKEEENLTAVDWKKRSEWGFFLRKKNIFYD